MLVNLLSILVRTEIIYNYFLVANYNLCSLCVLKPALFNLMFASFAFLFSLCIMPGSFFEYLILFKIRDGAIFLCITIY